MQWAHPVRWLSLSITVSTRQLRRIHNLINASLMQSRDESIRAAESPLHSAYARERNQSAPNGMLASCCHVSRDRLWRSSFSSSWVKASRVVSALLATMAILPHSPFLCLYDTAFVSEERVTERTCIDMNE